VKKRAVRWIFGISVFSAVLMVLCYVILFLAPNLKVSSTENWFTVKGEMSAEVLFDEHSATIQNALTWKIACMLKRVKTIKPGRYKLLSGMSNSEIIKEFRSGGLPTLTIRIDDTGTLEELAAKLGAVLLNDSVYFINSFRDDSLLKKVGTNQEELAAFIRPNTYEFFWSMSAETFLLKMKAENDKLWNTDRIEKAKSIGLTPFKTTILASIVKAETGIIDEAPTIAGLYLNRLRIDMPLQSDPTTIFGRKKSVQRVYESDLLADTPYNTYIHSGLPPGPINFPETVYIDAVLNANRNNYIYMCAQAGNTGRHNFTVYYQEHEKNRRAYIQWLEKSRIH